MEEKEKNQFLGANFYGSVTFNGPMFDIHDNGVVNLNVDQTDGMLNGKNKRMPEKSKEASDVKVKEKGQKGRKKTECFVQEVDVDRLSNSIKNIYVRSYSLSTNRIEINGNSFEQTNFLVSLYLALVKLSLSVSALNNVNKQYYEFLKERVKITSIASEKTFGNRFAKLVNSGNDFHNLNEAIVAKYENTGGFTKEEFPLWQQMVAVAIEELKRDEYIMSLLDELNN